MLQEEYPLRRVMILDENVLDLIEAQTALVNAGYEVIRMTAPNGALAKLDYTQPEILLLDITMRRINVKGLLRTLRQGEDFQDLIIVLFSDLEAAELQEYCVEYDAHGYYCKSMDIQKVPDFLEHFYEPEDPDSYGGGLEDDDDEEFF